MHGLLVREPHPYELDSLDYMRYAVCLGSHAYKVGLARSRGPSPKQVVNHLALHGTVTCHGSQLVTHSPCVDRCYGRQGELHGSMCGFSRCGVGGQKSFDALARPINLSCLGHMDRTLD